jgi:hypothetical protein
MRAHQHVHAVNLVERKLLNDAPQMRLRYGARGARAAEALRRKRDPPRFVW